MNLSNLFKSWAFFALITLLVMLTHTSKPAIILGRYSYSYFGGLTIVALTGGFALLGWRFSRLLASRIPSLPPSPIFTVGTITVVALAMWLAWWYLPGGKSDLGIVVLHLYLCALIAGVGIIILRATHLEDVSPPFQLAPVLFILLAIVCVALYLGHTPPSRYYEEPYVVDWAWSSYVEGVPDSHMVPSREPNHLATITGLSIPFMGFWMDITGISLESARLYVLLLAWAGAPFIFWVAQRLYNPLIARIALVIALLLPLAHNYAYPTSYVSTAVAIALYCYLRGQDSGRWQWHYLCGLAVSTGFEAHPYAICFAASFGFVYAFHYLRSCYKAKRLIFFYSPLWAFTVGGLTYAIALVILRGMIWAGADLIETFRLISEAYATEVAFSGPESNSWRLTAQWLISYPIQHPIEFVILLLGIGAALRRFGPSDRIILALFGGAIFCFSALIAHYNPYYWIHHLPFTALFGALFIANAYKNLPKNLSWQILIRLVGVLTLFLANAHRIASKGQNHDDLIAIGYQINELLTPEVERVSGYMIYYYGLSRRQFVHSGAFVDTPAEMWEEKYDILPPQAIVVTQGLDNAFDALQSYIQTNQFLPVACFATHHFGKQVILYTRPNWVQGNPPHAILQAKP